MTPHDLERVKSAHAEALVLSAPERARYLERTFPDEPALREEVRKLLAWHDEAGDFLSESLANRFEGFSIEDQRLQRVGPYELVKEIGRGGSATVYLARRADDLYEKLVAIKLFSRLSHSEAFLLRFQREIQMLARIEHPYVVRLLDAGATDSLAYIVTEFVEGQPIDRFAEGIPLRERLRLFLRVCEGVSCAHERLIVHRDLKPSNVLVAADGLPKLLDFGIAVLLDSEVSLTYTGMERMTVQYASPEQIRREKEITRASDVYALGVILYELIAGRLPYGGPEYELTSRILADDPPPLQNVAFDLEQIVRKALRKAPAERYASVEHLRADVGRFLNNLPVAARSDSAIYRGRKFVRRHWVTVTAAASVVTAVAAVSAVWVMDAMSAKQQSQQVKNLLIRGFSEVRDGRGGWVGLGQLRMVEATRLSYLQSLPAGMREDRDIQSQRFYSFRVLGTVQGLPSTLNLGLTGEAQTNLSKAVAIGEELLTRLPGAVTGRDLALAHIELGNVLLEMDRPSEAQAQFARAGELVSGENSELPARAGLEAMAQKSRILCLQGKQEEALAIRREIVARRRAIYLEDPKGMAWEYAGGLCSYGELLRQMRRFEEARAAYSEALPIIEGSAAADPIQLNTRWNLARQNEEFGRVLLATGIGVEAAEHLDRAIELYRSIAKQEPDAASNQRALALCLATRGQLMATNGKSEAGRRLLQEAMELSAEAAGRDRASARAQAEWSGIRTMLRPVEQAGNSGQRAANVPAR